MAKQLLTETATTLTAEAVKGSGDFLIQLITPGWGSSGYYAADVLESAGKRGVFAKGTQMFANHQTAEERNTRPEGDLMGLAAVLQEDAYWNGSALVAKARPFQHWAPVLKDMKEAIGVSIRASAEISEGEAEGRRGIIVDELIETQSVDFVTRAGRGGKILEVLESAHATAVGYPAPLGVALTPMGQSTSTSSNGLSVWSNGTNLTYVPVSSAGQTTESQKGNTVQIDDARYAQLNEAAGQVPTLIAERDAARKEAADAKEAADKLAASLAEATAKTDAEKRVREAVKTLPPLAGDRVVREALRSLPMKDGALDVTIFEATITEAVKAEAAYLAALAPNSIHGFGASGEPVIESTKPTVTPWGRSLTGKVA